MEERGKGPSRPKPATSRPAASRAPATPPAGATPATGPHVLPDALSSLRLPMLLTDGRGLDASILAVNPRFEQLIGYDAAEVTGRSLRSLLANKGDAALEERLAKAASAPPASDAAEHDPECCFRRKDGTHFWAALAVTPVRDMGSGVPGHLVALQNMTPHRHEADQLRILLAELNHRTQNMFSAVLEMVRHSLRGKAPAALVDTLAGRILAFSRAQNLLRDEVDGGITLRQVLSLVLQPPGIPKDLTSRVVLEGPDVRLATNAALTTAMALHELAVNAVRHGALSEDAGMVRIQWTVRSPSRGGQLSLRWQETGGPRIKPLYDKGFGMRLIEGGVQHGLGGTARLSLEASGLVCDITLPLRHDGRQDGRN